MSGAGADAEGGAGQPPDRRSRILAAALSCFNERGFADTLTRLQQAGIAAVRVDPGQSLAELIIARGLVTANEHPDFGPYWQHLPNVEFSRSSSRVGPPCGIGEHSTAILAELGYSDADIRAWITQPAHQNWQWMGNMCCFVEPISFELMEKRAASAKQIITELRALGNKIIG